MQAVRKSFDINYRTLIHALFIVSCICFFILPFWMLLSVSFTDEKAIVEHGYSIFPRAFSLAPYQYVFANPKQIINSYMVTIGMSFLGTLLSTVIMSLCAYPLSRSYFKLRKPLTFYVFFTMIFSGGLIPQYIVNTRILGLRDNFLIYVLPYLCSAFYIIILRTYFSSLPLALVESAKIDGASELRIFFQLIIPLSKPVLATISLFVLLDRWNDWFTSLLYIYDQKLYSLQFLLQKILLELEFLKNLTVEAPAEMSTIDIPSEGMRYAMAVVAAGPMLLVFPFFQKYFVKGLTIGSVKG